MADVKISALTELNETPASNDVLPIVDTSATKTKKINPQNLLGAINNATEKTTPADGDFMALIDSAASYVLKKLSWSNLKATLKTYFDTLYASLTNFNTHTGASSGVHGATGTIVGTSDTQTLTNKRIKKRTSTTTTATSLTPDISQYDLYQFTAQASALTINNPVGTPVLGETLVILVKASGSDQTITYGTEYKAMGQALITTATNGKWLEIIAEYTESGVWLTSTTIQQ